MVPVVTRQTRLILAQSLFFTRFTHEKDLLVCKNISENSSMTTERLSALAILSTEVDLALFIDLDDFYIFFFNNQEE